MGWLDPMMVGVGSDVLVRLCVAAAMAGAMALTVILLMLPAWEAYARPADPLAFGASFPWCDACRSWHHPRNQTCRRLVGHPVDPLDPAAWCVAAERVGAPPWAGARDDDPEDPELVLFV